MVGSREVRGYRCLCITRDEAVDGSHSRPRHKLEMSFVRSGRRDRLRGCVRSLRTMQPNGKLQNKARNDSR